MEVISKRWAVAPFTFFQLAALSTNLYIVPQLVVSKVCHNKFNFTVCDQLGQMKFKAQENSVYEEAAAWNALITFAGFLPATCIILPLGAMTDLVSKKKVLLLPAMVSLVSSLINLCSSVFIRSHLGYLVLASFVTCIFGEIPGCISICCTYSASASTVDRTLALTLTMASVEIGLAIGGLVGNYLKRYFGFPSVFMFAATVLAVNILYAIVLVPPVDDVDEKSSKENQYDLWNGIKEHTKDTWHHLVSFTKKHLLHPEDNTILLLLTATFFNLAAYGGERALIALFLKHSPLNFKADQIGIYITLFQFSRGVGLIILSLILYRLFQISDYTLMIAGVVSKIVKFIILSFSTTPLMVYLSTIFACCASFMASCVRSKLTKLVSVEEHGVTLSLFGLLSGASVTVMAVASNGLFAATAKVFSGFGMLCMSCLNVVCLIILFYIVLRKRKVATPINYDKIATMDKRKD